jgi:hypothetical protein
MLREVRAVVQLYTKRGFRVVGINADKEFECIKEEMFPIQVNIVDKDNHVAEVERSIRVVKERVRCTIAGLPFKRFPRVMIRGMVNFAISSLNQLPALNGVSTLMSPLTIMTGRGNVDFNKFKLEFGEYAQIFEDNAITNTTNARTTGGIAMNHSGSHDGGYNFMSLESGKTLSRKQWTTVLMPEWVVGYVEQMAEAENQKVLTNGEPLWEWRPGHTIDNDDTHDDADGNFEEHFRDEFIEDVEMQVGIHENIDEDPNIENDPIADVDDDALEDNPPQHDVPNPALISDFDETSSDDDLSSHTPSSNDSDISFDADSSMDNSTDSDSTTHNADDDLDAAADLGLAPDQRSVENNNDNINDPEPTQPTPALRRSNRQRNNTNYKVRFSDNMAAAGNAKSYRPHHQLLQQGIEDFKSNNNDTKNLQKYITGFIFNQMTAKAGIKKHEQIAIDALMTEFKQLNDKSVFKGLDAKKLSRKDKRQAL